jgi:hypothetical protein
METSFKHFTHLRLSGQILQELDGASEENRTPTPVRVLDFESSASTSSATEAL